ncbi:hypothetical protein ACYPKM_04940 [Pseudomonas aeruginosa]
MSQFLMQETESRSGGSLAIWWRHDDCGYTTDINSARLFSFDEAQKQNQMRHTDIPVPVELLRSKAARAINMEKLRADAPEASLNRGKMVYAQIKGCWNGNSPAWVSKDGSATYTLENALAMTRSEGEKRQASWSSLVLWPVDYIEKNAVAVVDVFSFNAKRALKGTGIELTPAPKLKSLPERCEGCGRFMSVQQRWAGDCRHCGTDNQM